MFHGYIKLGITAMYYYTWPHITEEGWCGDMFCNLVPQISVQYQSQVIAVLKLRFLYKAAIYSLTEDLLAS